MKTMPTKYAVPTALLETPYNWDLDDACELWTDDSIFTYNELKEQAQYRIAHAKSPSELIRYTRVLLYIEHRAMREHNLCI